MPMEAAIPGTTYRAFTVRRYTGVSTDPDYPKCTTSDDSATVILYVIDESTGDVYFEQAIAYHANRPHLLFVCNCDQDHPWIYVAYDDDEGAHVYALELTWVDSATCCEAPATGTPDFDIPGVDRPEGFDPSGKSSPLPVPSGLLNRGRPLAYDLPTDPELEPPGIDWISPGAPDPEEPTRGPALWDPGLRPRRGPTGD